MAGQHITGQAIHASRNIKFDAKKNFLYFQQVENLKEGHKETLSRNPTTTGRKPNDPRKPLYFSSFNDRKKNNGISRNNTYQQVVKKIDS